VCPHFHVSLQSGCDATLARMGRRYTAEEFERAVNNLRMAIPACTVSTDMIVGFPGETEEDFEVSRAFAQKIGFDTIHVFPFSAREGTPAARMQHPVPKREKMRRARLLAETAAQLEQASLARAVGTRCRVLLEEYDESGRAVGYTPQYLRVRLDGPGGERGTEIETQITGWEGTTLLGAVIRPGKEAMQDCVFCSIRDGSILSPKIYEDEDCFAIRDIHPQAKEHLLVISKVHVQNVAQATSEPGLLEKLFSAAVRVARQEGLEVDGYRLVTNMGRFGCQSVAHLHIHILGGEQLSERMGAE